MNGSNNIILNRIFTQSIFKNLLDNQHDATYCTVVKKYINNPEAKTNRELISALYKTIGKSYRNEYFYKNTILNKLLLGRHSPRTTTALTEIPIAKSKADFVLINGKAIVYEIKTELDTFERLDSQLADYYKAFSRVCVVTCESNHDYISQKLRDTPVGICLLTKKNTLSMQKEPMENFSSVVLSVMFKILRKNEYESVIKKYYGELPKVTSFNYYSACQKLFCDLQMDVAYEFFLRELKKRQKVDVLEYSDVPYELKFLIYFSRFGKENYLELHKFLTRKFGG